MHSIYSKIKLFIYLSEAFVVLDWPVVILIFGWSVVSYHHSNTLQLCATVFHSYGTSP